MSFLCISFCLCGDFQWCSGSSTLSNMMCIYSTSMLIMSAFHDFQCKLERTTTVFLLGKLLHHVFSWHHAKDLQQLNLFHNITKPRANYMHSSSSNKCGLFTSIHMQLNLLTESFLPGQDLYTKRPKMIHLDFEYGTYQQYPYPTMESDPEFRGLGNSATDTC